MKKISFHSSNQIIRSLAKSPISERTHLVFIALTLFFIGALALAQTPQKLSYQSVVRGSYNQLLTDTLIGIRISILQGSVDGPEVYSETQTPKTNSNGLFSIEIGSGQGFDAINWANGPFFVKTEIDPKGGSNYTITGFTQFLSVPYAFHAKLADSTSNEADPVFNAWGKDYNSLTNRPQNATTSTDGLMSAADKTKLKNLRNADGSETKITAGQNISVSGTGTEGDPYVVKSNAVNHYVGELYGGGIVFYVSKDEFGNEHGLICSMVDISPSQAWSDRIYTAIGETARSTWNGKDNTTAIVNQPGATTSAALLCYNYVNEDYGTGVFSDWYLPAEDELIRIFYARIIINRILDTDGNPSTIIISNATYWSSTELNDIQARSGDFLLGNMLNFSNKSQLFHVRAIRSF